MELQILFIGPSPENEAGIFFVNSFGGLNKRIEMKRVITQSTILIAAFLGLSGAGTVWDKIIFCSSNQNPATLYMRMNFPNPKDDCDIAYDHDCKHIVGDYVLRANLLLPDLAGDAPQGELERVTDIFSEVAENGLEIAGDQFSFRLDADFKSQLDVKGHVSVEITTNSSFKLTCRPAN